jgi:hypothetical protein
MSKQFKRVVVSVINTTELTLVVPADIDTETITEAVGQYWAVREEEGFLDAHSKLIPGSEAVIVRSSGEGNDVIWVNDESNTETIDEEAVRATWTILRTNLDGSDEDRAAYAAEYEQNLSRTDPKTLNDFALIKALTFMYPGDAPGSHAKLSRKRRLAAYHDYFRRMDPGLKVRQSYVEMLARLDPAKMSPQERLGYLMWMYPGQAAKWAACLKAAQQCEAYRRYFQSSSEVTQ